LIILINNSKLFQSLFTRKHSKKIAIKLWPSILNVYKDYRNSEIELSPIQLCLIEFIVKEISNELFSNIIDKKILETDIEKLMAYLLQLKNIDYEKVKEQFYETISKLENKQEKSLKITSSSKIKKESDSDSGNQKIEFAGKTNLSDSEVSQEFLNENPFDDSVEEKKKKSKKKPNLKNKKQELGKGNKTSSPIEPIVTARINVKKSKDLDEGKDTVSI